MPAGLFQVMTGVALLIVRVFVLELPLKPPPEVKLAPTPFGYVPALIPVRLTFESVATPLALVVDVLPAKPAPFKVKLMSLPLSGDPPCCVKVAESVVVPP